MRSDSLVFSHQRESVIALSKHFESIEVFTTEDSFEILPNNIRVIEISWKKNSPLRNTFIIFRSVFPHLARHRKATVFTHMADVHAALISPMTWLLRMKHILWYAHATNSLFFIWSSFFVSKILSSTPGSCRIKINRRKVKFINQGINERDFPYLLKKSHNLKKLFYYGRLDKSKNVHLMLELVRILNRRDESFSIDIFGKTAKSSSDKYILELKKDIVFEKRSSQIRFNNSIERKQIPFVANDFGIFLNLFSGSLDKTLIENTLMGIPVVTWNEEYCLQFGTWSDTPAEASLSFVVQEIESLLKLKKIKVKEELARRHRIALDNHSFEGWIKRLTSEILDGV
jgi:glycosyltransferase involved in cell wall biosynthesis